MLFRDTSRESDVFRFHLIISHGGDLVNVVPDLVTMESYTRASNIDTMINGNKRVKLGIAR